MIIRLFCPINPTGVGTHAQLLIDALLAHKDKITLVVVPTGVVSHSIDPIVRDKISYHLMHTDYSVKPDVDIVLDVPNKCIQWLENNVDGRAKISVAYTVFENPLTSQESDLNHKGFLIKQILEEFDHLLLPSGWAVDEVVGNFPELADKVSVLREGFTSQIVERTSDASYITIGNIGKFEYRKGHFSLVSALSKVRCEIPVKLNAYWHNWWDSSSVTHALVGWKKIKTLTSNVYQHLDTQNLIILKDRFTWQKDLYISAASCDAMVFPTLSEGWGLPIGDSISLGINTFSTGATGSSEYFDKYAKSVDELKLYNPRILQKPNSEEAVDGRFFKPEDKEYWYDVHQDSLFGVLKDIAYAKKCGHFWERDHQFICSDMKREFSWSNSAKRLLELLGV